ncbi:hypothetical protein AALP_AA7G018100 [Arabis alpina]|uniref:RNase H type-1 domain-containing protein n=1 Tax=Arabis alpina TaxID=50452 RepID=A0A087GFE5_ARAAL|nr:hypothetical protein AALP_AA7G018100 [Arabis alpina]
MKEALIQLQHRNFKNLSIISDSQQLITFVNNRGGHLEIYGILQDIFKISTEIKISAFNFIPRTCNSDSDRIAKNALFLAPAMGLPEVFISWIRCCISSASFSVCVNGELEDCQIDVLKL